MDNGEAMTLPSLPARVGIIGDIHAEDSLLEAALDHLQTKNAQAILCTGDVADGPGSVARCCELLHQCNAQTVRGNHDRWLLTGTMRDLPDATDPQTVPAAARDYLANLVATLEFSSSLGNVLLCHGLGLNDMARLEPDDFGYALDNNADLQNLIRNQKYRFVVNGHTHHAMVRHFTGLTVINAGTLRRHDNYGFLLLDFDQRQVQMLRFGKEREITVHSTYDLLPAV